MRIESVLCHSENVNERFPHQIPSHRLTRFHRLNTQHPYEYQTNFQFVTETNTLSNNQSINDLNGLDISGSNNETKMIIDNQIAPPYIPSDELKDSSSSIPLHNRPGSFISYNRARRLARQHEEFAAELQLERQEISNASLRAQQLQVNTSNDSDNTQTHFTMPITPV